MPLRELVIQLPGASVLKCVVPSLKICLRDFNTKAKHKGSKEIQSESGKSLPCVYCWSLQNAGNLVHHKTSLTRCNRRFKKEKEDER